MLSQQGWQKKGTESSARALPQLAHSTGKTTFSTRLMRAAMAGMVIRLAEYMRADKVRSVLLAGVFKEFPFALSSVHAERGKEDGRTALPGRAHLQRYSPFVKRLSRAATTRG